MTVGIKVIDLSINASPRVKLLFIKHQGYLMGIVIYAKDF